MASRRLPPFARDLAVSESGQSRSSPESLFVESLDLIERTIRFVATRSRVSREDREEFASEVMVRLVDNNYEILRKFEGRSQLRTFLAVVIQRMFLDFRNRQWGKWRPSTEAVRMGPLAVRLETLISRQGLTFPEASEHLRTNDHIEVEEEELLAIACRLPRRVRRRDVDADLLEYHVADEQADDLTLLRETQATKHRVMGALACAIERLPDRDRLILRMRFEGGLAVVDIARALHLDAKRLYRQLEAILRQLRRAMQDAGIVDADANEVLNGRYDIALAVATDLYPPPSQKGTA